MTTIHITVEDPTDVTIVVNGQVVQRPERRKLTPAENDDLMERFRYVIAEGRRQAFTQHEAERRERERRAALRAQQIADNRQSQRILT